MSVQSTRTAYALRALAQLVHSHHRYIILVFNLGGGQSPTINLVFFSCSPTFDIIPLGTWRVIRLHMDKTETQWNWNNIWHSATPVADSDRVCNGRPILLMCGSTSATWFLYKLRQSLSSGRQYPKVVERTQCSSQIPTQINQAAWRPINGPTGTTPFSIGSVVQETMDRCRPVWWCSSCWKTRCSRFPVAVVSQGTVTAYRGMVLDALSPWPWSKDVQPCPRRRKSDRTYNF
jgi:hypothetical protein